jgi:uncharacterized protein with GYD domain
MAQYIILMNWTDQGVRNVKDSPKRLDTGRAVAKKLGMEMKDFYMTMGEHDMVAHLDAPNDETVAKFILGLATLGNVRTKTLWRSRKTNTARSFRWRRRSAYQERGRFPSPFVDSTKRAASPFSGSLAGGPVSICRWQAPPTAPPQLSQGAPTTRNCRCNAPSFTLPLNGVEQRHCPTRLPQYPRVRTDATATPAPSATTSACLRYALRCAMASF